MRREAQYSLVIQRRSHPLLPDQVIRGRVFHGENALLIKSDPLGHTWPGWGILFSPALLHIEYNWFLLSAKEEKSC